MKLFHRTVAAVQLENKPVSFIEVYKTDMKAVVCFCLDDVKFGGLPMGLLFTDT